MIVVGISGAKGSGKDTAAAWLVQHAGFVRVGFADALKAEVRTRLRRTLLRISGYVGPYVGAPVGPDGERHLMQPPDEEARLDWLIREKPPIVRELLQEYGTEVRRVDAADYWLREWAKVAAGLERVVVPDVRFPDEAEMLLGRRGALLKIERPALSGGDDHASETSLAAWPRWSAVLKNTGTVEDLQAQVAEWWGAR